MFLVNFQIMIKYLILSLGNAIHFFLRNAQLHLNAHCTLRVSTNTVASAKNGIIIPVKYEKPIDVELKL